jgi:hypothetical protein
MADESPRVALEACSGVWNQSMAVVSWLICLALLPGTLQAGPEGASNAVASMSVETFTDAFLDWRIHHPELFETSARLVLGVPSIDLYDPLGVSIYHGEDSEKNAAFIRTLQRNTAQTQHKLARPTLKEIIGMIPEFRARQEALLSTDGRYTIVAVTYPSWARCKAQNDAIEELRRRSIELGVRVLEVRLRSPAQRGVFH